MSHAPAIAPHIEQIVDTDQRPLACIVYASHKPPITEFVTPTDWTQQVGFVVYRAGTSIPRHRHLPIQRKIIGTGEVLVVRKGHCEVELYADGGILIAQRELHVGDVLILIAGGHGFHMIEDTVLLEIKQGPYTGLTEKKYF
ncbi:MAG: hypothetical protein HY287_15245 [Planctomycetes bacterium]|nr:hypothetical protein [Planctomycetota bacterium]MBI3835680.1 hypothetical protein [Planctomycetota bacterium]